MFIRFSAVLLVVFGMVGSLSAKEYTITLTNLTKGIHFTPFLVSAHNSTTHLFQAGEAASTNLEAMAEGGDISGLLSDLGGADADTIENPAAGLLAPGASASTTINTDDTGNTHLSIVAMLLPTNDGFAGLDADSLPASGTKVVYLSAYDAGTENNDELITSMPGDPGGQASSSAAGGTGATDLNSVHIHPGVLGDATGTTSDLKPAIHRWLNPVIKVVITVN